jgi:glycosyltransferase involved in cell wall biosynthesis
MGGEPHVSVVLPVYNQADHVERIVTGYLQALDALRHEVELILVVNASRDGSLDVCRRLETEHNAVRVLNHDRPGWGLAVRIGLDEARGQFLVYTNSARTTAHVLALHVLMGLANPEWVVKANRRLRHPWMRRIGSVVYNVECRSLFDLPVWDINGTPKVMSRDTYRRLEITENGDLIDLEVIVRCRQLGVQILEIPIVSAIRHGGESTTNIASGFKMYWGAYQMHRRFRDAAIPCTDPEEPCDR